VTDPAKMKKQEKLSKVFKVRGMDCADCALKIEKVVSKIPGVKLVEVSFATSTLKVTTETPQFDFGAVLSAIRNLGCSVEAEESGKTVTLKVEGMDCVNESEIIEKKMKSLAGVNSFEINFMTQQLKISYDPSLISVQDMIKAIAETGMRGP